MLQIRDDHGSGPSADRVDNFVYTTGRVGSRKEWPVVYSAADAVSWLESASERALNWRFVWYNIIIIPDAGQSPTLARPAAPLASKNRLPWRRPANDRKTNFTPITYNHSLVSINPHNLAKIGLVGVEIIGLTGTVKNLNFNTSLKNFNICPKLC